jgi:hypothetical protein
MLVIDKKEVDHKSGICLIKSDLYYEVERACAQICDVHKRARTKRTTYETGLTLGLFSIFWPEKKVFGHFNVVKNYS